MAFLKKLLYRNIIKYGAYAIVPLYLFLVIRIWSLIYDAFSYSDVDLKYSGLKHVLVWNSYYMTLNNKKEPIFPTLQCPVSNCIFTVDRDLLDGDYTRFDALLFDETILNSDEIDLPEKRAASQIYIFTTIESSYNYPACEVRNDDFFNWTFTYRVDSDLQWRYIVVRDVTRDIVAPSKHVQWQKYDQRLTVISSDIINLFHTRTKAAAWLVSHCGAENARDEYLTQLQEHLFHFSLRIDVFGKCNKMKCPYGNCEKMLRKNYYFYMAFENSFSEDYVTEKVLHGYNNYVVPIVYGGANYSRFLPPGSYLDARKIHPYNLAYIMHQAMKNPKTYYEFFKWTNYYTIDAPEPHPLCDLCEALNSDKRQRSLKTFRLWWNGRKGFQWCLPQEYWNETSLLHVDIRDLIKNIDLKIRHSFKGTLKRCQETLWLQNIQSMGIRSPTQRELSETSSTQSKAAIRVHRKRHR